VVGVVGPAPAWPRWHTSRACRPTRRAYFVAYVMISATP